MPFPVRRSIYRVSAILETVDLEFERVLDARESYISSITPDGRHETLNVDLLASTLDSLLPEVNKDDSESYSDLLPELLEFGIDSPDKLKDLLKTHLEQALKEDARFVKMFSNVKALTPAQASRIAKGAFMSHAGLTRTALRNAFGEKYSDYLLKHSTKTG